MVAGNIGNKDITAENKSESLCDLPLYQSDDANEPQPLRT